MKLYSVSRLRCEILFDHEANTQPNVSIDKFKRNAVLSRVFQWDSVQDYLGKPVEAPVVLNR